MNSARNSLILCLLFLTCCAPIRSTGRDESRPAGPGGYFQASMAPWSVFQLSEDRTFRYNPDRCSERLLPASTFKIMNAFGRSGNRRCSRPGFRPALGWNRIRDSRVEPGPLFEDRFSKLRGLVLPGKSPGAWDLKRCSTISMPPGMATGRWAARSTCSGWMAH